MANGCVSARDAIKRLSADRARLLLIVSLVCVHNSSRIRDRCNATVLEAQRAVLARAQGTGVPKARPTPWVQDHPSTLFLISPSPVRATRQIFDNRYHALMPQSLTRVHIHLIFSTKHRLPVLHDDVRESLHRYAAAVLQNIECPPLLINSVEDHIHILHELGRTISISKAVQELKTSTSRWLKTQSAPLSDFAWQSGYGAFGISCSNVDAICTYIADQHEHHRTTTFQDEFRAFLDRHGVAYDERYVWD